MAALVISMMFGFCHIAADGRRPPQLVDILCPSVGVSHSVSSDSSGWGEACRRSGLEGNCTQN